MNKRYFLLTTITLLVFTSCCAKQKVLPPITKYIVPEIKCTPPALSDIVFLKTTATYSKEVSAHIDNINAITKHLKLWRLYHECVVRTVKTYKTKISNGAKISNGKKQ